MAELDAMAPTLSVRRRCAVLGISRSWWYARPDAPAADAAAGLALREAIEGIVLENA